MATVTNFSLPLTLGEVAKSLSTTEDFLRPLVGRVRARQYSRFEIAKARGGFRRGWCCKDDNVATLHKTLARRLAAYVTKRHGAFPSSIAHGYVSERSTTSNAKVHCGARLLLSVDIENFFGSISKRRVVSALQREGISPSAAKLISALCTLEGALPLGLHASPVLANLACLRLDRDLLALAERWGAKVTRYADDIAFSGDAVPSVDDVAAILAKHRFAINLSKCRTTTRGQAHFVTGLAISDTVPRIPRRKKARLRQELHFIKKFGLASHLERTREDLTEKRLVNRIEGTLRYFNAVEGALAAKLRRKWEQAVPGEARLPAFAPRVMAGASVSILIDEAGFSTHEGPMLAIGMVVTKQAAEIEATLEDLLRKYLTDQYSTGDKLLLEKKGLHAADNSEDLKTKVFEVLETAPIRAHVAYNFLSSDVPYREQWLCLLKELLVHRFMYLDGADVTVIYEENPQVPVRSVQDLVDHVYKQLENDDNRRPRRVRRVVEGTKRSHPSLATADYLLMAFQQFANVERPQENPGVKKKQQPGELATKRFDRLRDRVRLIRSVVTKENFTRQNPFEPWREGSPSYRRPK